MSVSSWHHAAVAVTSLAGEPPDGLESAWADPAPLRTRAAHIDAEGGSYARAGRVLAERLRALRPGGHGVPARLGARIVARWLVEADIAMRPLLVRWLDAEGRELVRAEAPWVGACADAAAGLRPWLELGVRALRAPLSLACLQSLGEDLAEIAPAAHPDALRVERALRVHGLRARAEGHVRALAEGLRA